LASRFDSSGHGGPQGLARGELLEQRREVGRYGYASTASQDQDAPVVAHTLTLKQRYALLYDGVAHGGDAVFDVALDLLSNAYAAGDAYVSGPYADAAQTFKVSPVGKVI